MIAEDQYKPWLKPLVFLAALSPLLWLAGRALRQDLGADPLAVVLNRLGLYALVLVFCSLSCTPLQIVFGWNWPLRVRRMLGLFAFAYACLHLSTYLAIDQFFDFAAIGKDFAKRRFILVGLAAWCALVPLAVTSTQKWIRRLGYARWKRLHRLAYLAAVLGAVHFVWRLKTALPQLVLLGTLLVLLLGARVVGWTRAAQKRSGAVRSGFPDAIEPSVPISSARSTG
ncbi:MAG TPA: protein-methionine-sulfoxide reductase heme-binding subunit MsrQ [Myxococcales bacterium]|nr:protein-methionine-sulfoxide reductase heme-binding subunit MsrQ [Myxococcales bacterium]